MGAFWGLTKPPAGTAVDFSHPVTEGLELWHICNEGSGVTVYDQMGRSNRNGTRKETPGNVEIDSGAGLWTSGLFGPALQGGSSQAGPFYYTDLGSAHGIPISATQPFTFSAWTFWTGSGEASFFGNADGADVNTCWIVEWADSSGDYVMYQYATGSSIAAYTSDLSIVHSWPRGVWRHIAVTDDGKNTATSVNIWIDGQKQAVGQLLTGTGRATTNQATSLGIVSTGPGKAFVGKYDNFMIWSRVLAEAAIQQLRTEPFAAMMDPVWRRYLDLGSLRQ